MSNSEQQLNSKQTPKRSTIMLVSGDLDKALLAFEIATGQAAMGMEVTMWFTLYGVNCLKKPRSIFSLSKWLPKQSGDSKGHKAKTDHFLQHLLRLLNRDGANRIPLSQLNLFGVGPWVLGKIMQRKGMAPLEDLIRYAEELGIRFRVCQICVDALALHMEDELVVEAEALGVSSYTIDTNNAHYNAVI
ncbi:hypothetical protein BOW53_14535 [Solemya pervernicosa gill symbiont]|uniref:NADH dehydrogenase n=2 Tax=Gammaproteobacteria incertae sedis TaxID=118884 RepID=A0A1T2L0V1_9GAMM|nr:DsrE/DsrF/DrsH-like family protein [Candidatus Reidiella endopervernicosa]OOZ38735.1 hypothetical protein BOW53_14535 [Solemya pervernicosa gill symbiont]QKQ25852.1 DsrE/DsrF/DrsH-like family protein [Candidatus Reidiella endopervernicosa]